MGPGGTGRGSGADRRGQRAPGSRVRQPGVPRARRHARRRGAEILGCRNAKNGCGDSECCRFCGAQQAILETQRTHRAATRECHFTIDSPERGLDLLARSVPFEIGDTRFMLVSFVDISGQKRRSSLERIFFHDILNTASSFKVYLDLLRRGTRDQGSLGLISKLASIADTMAEEIQGQRLLVSAESGTLKVQRDLVESTDLAQQLIGQSEGLEIAAGRTLAIAPFSESFTFVADDSLLKRVLGNMLKNALEASPEGSAVTIGFGKDEERARFSVHNETAMDPEVQQQVFRRYFSTKGDDRGLGTWGMRLLAEEYLGGEVTFTSSPAEGTRFVLSLPLRPRER
jgi:signal transduction histidine kinase